MLDARYNAEIQYLIYWRKGMFAIGRKCICGERFTLSYADVLDYTHMTMEEMIAREEVSNFSSYIDAMWSAMKGS